MESLKLAPLHLLVQILPFLFVFEVGNELADGIDDLGFGEVVMGEDVLQLSSTGSLSIIKKVSTSSMVCRVVFLRQAQDKAFFLASLFNSSKSPRMRASFLALDQP